MTSAQEKRTMKKLSRGELEERYMSVLDENVFLKKHTRNQEERIKKLAAKMLRLSQDAKKTQLAPGESGGLALHDTEEAKRRILVLEQQKGQLVARMKAMKHQLG
ncbi:unnamed protein product, partial [Darwinula stevensoni]